MYREVGESVVEQAESRSQQVGVSDSRELEPSWSQREPERVRESGRQVVEPQNTQNQGVSANLGS